MSLDSILAINGLQVVIKNFPFLLEGRADVKDYRIVGILRHGFGPDSRVVKAIKKPHIIFHRHHIY